MTINKILISILKKIVLLSSILVFSTSCYSSKKNPPGSSFSLTYTNFNDYYTNFYEPLKKRNPHRYMCFVGDQANIIYSIDSLFAEKEEFEQNKGDIIYDELFVSVNVILYYSNYSIRLELYNLARKQVDITSDVHYNLTSSGDGVFYLGDVFVCACYFTSKNNYPVSNEEKTELCDQFIPCFSRGLDYVL